MLVACIALLPGAEIAWAHQLSVSFGELVVHGRTVDGKLRFRNDDLRSAGLLPGTAPITLALNYGVASDGQPCAPAASPSVRAEGAEQVVAIRWVCVRDVEALEVDAGKLIAALPGHAHLVQVGFDGSDIAQRELDSSGQAFTARRSSRLLQGAGRFLRLGVEHIFTGYDHIAFLLGLLLLGGRLRDLLKIVTSFTVAHSITLALAALSILSPPSRLVEPMIAVSIVFVGSENLWVLSRGRGSSTSERIRRIEAALHHRWLLTFGFGLIHGFGFASVLRELNLPRAALATGLLSFNLGVEVGQVCIVALAWPILSRVARRPVAAWMSAAIAGLGAVWFILRVSGS